MFRSLYYSSRRQLHLDLQPHEFARALRDRQGLLWVDFSGESAEVCEPILRGFGFHPLAIDDALQETHAPKVDDWDDYLYIVLNSITLSGRNSAGWETLVDELDIFIGPNYIVTHHDTPMPFLDRVWSASQRDPHRLQEGADHLLYRVIDNMVTDYMPLVEQIDQALDELEDQVFARPTPSTLTGLFALKRVLLAMRRIIVPQREVLNRLARDDYAVIDPRGRIFFRDIYDHLVRMHDLNESMRDLVGGALDTYLSVINNRMNEVMKTLTIITTLFMPLSFVAGFFGMNFFLPRIPLSTWMERPVFYLVIILLALTPIVMYRWMRRRMWV